MRDLLRRLWPLFKWLLTAAILVFLGLHFWRDLQKLEVWERWLRRPQYLAAAGLLYLLGIGFSGVYWRRLLARFDRAPSLLIAERAYYLGHLGKYLPGKAWALFLRASLVRDAGVGPALATMTAFYEVLVTMSSAVLLAAVLFAALAPPSPAGLDLDYLRRIILLQGDESNVVDRNTSVALSLLLLVPVGLPVVPPVFNRLVHHLSLPFRDKDTPAPAVPWPAYFEGLAVTGWGWVLQAGSLAVLVFAAMETLPQDVPWQFLGRVVAIMGASYVAGFVIMLPSGLGVREYFLTLFLVPELQHLLGVAHADARAQAVQAVIVLRLVWTAAELVIASVVYWFRPTPTDMQRTTDNGQRTKP
jgi:uncharacterized membrane protein YbhN (UPF0104 family)